MSNRNWAKELGFKSVGSVCYNPSYKKLHEDELQNKEGVLTNLGAIAVDTGKFTGRSPKDKYFVDSDPSNKYIAIGNINKHIDKSIYEKLYKKWGKSFEKGIYYKWG